MGQVHDISEDPNMLGIELETRRESFRLYLPNDLTGDVVDDQANHQHVVEIDYRAISAIRVALNAAERSFHQSDVPLYRVREIIVPAPEVTSETTLDDLGSALGAVVYAVLAPIERAESLRLLHGNGHHLRQRVSDIVRDLLRERWNDAEQVRAVPRRRPG